MPITTNETARRQPKLIVLTLFVLLSGCASYQPRPLPDLATPANDLDMLTTQVNKSLRPGNGIREIDPADGLDLTEVSILAVLGNPDLRAKRAQLKVAGAQVFAAGLLPDPQLSVNLDNPTSNAPGLVNAWGLGLGYDIIPLITRQARISAEQSGVSKVRLELLWQEWQVIQQARSLGVRFQLEEVRLSLLHKMRNLYQDRYQHSEQGLREGNVTLDVNGTDLTALIDSFSQITQLEQQHNQTRHALNHLLGLQSDVRLTLAKLPAETTIDPASVQRQLKSLPSVRPDLLALKAGYQVQEAHVRAAILAQFPSFGIGISRARDTGSIYTSGLNIGLVLPLFSGNRGAIAIERATREQLYQEYQARIVQTQTDVNRLLELQAIIERQRTNLQAYLPRLQSLVERARRAYRHGDIAALTFLNMESTWVNKRLEQISLQQTQWENRIALQTLLTLPEGKPIPTNPPEVQDHQP